VKWRIEMIMSKADKRAIDRKAKKLRRLAYELEHDAAAISGISGFNSIANGVRELSSRAGDIGRTMHDLLDAIL
jgi:hypothetical protein